MKFVRFALMILLVFTAYAPAQYSASPSVPDRWLNGASGYTRAVELQQQWNVPMVVYFYVDWCPYCRTLDSQYFPAAEVQSYLSRVVKVRINPEFGRAERELAARYGVSGYPSFLIVRNASSTPIRVHPFKQNGSLSPAEFARACNQAGPVALNTASLNARASARTSQATASKITKSVTTQERPGGVQITTVKPTKTASPTLISDGPLPTVSDILAKYVEALGGKAAQMRLTSRVTRGRVDVPGVSNGGRMESYAMAPNRSLTKMEIDTLGVIRQGFDGRTGWDQADNFGVRVASGAKLAGLARDAEFHGALKLSELYARFKLLGKVKEGFREVYLVQASPRVGAPEMLYFDIETGLLVRCDVSRPTSKGVVRAEVYLSDWREVDGVKIPFRTTEAMPGLTFVFTVEEVKHNVALDPAIFRRPTG